MIDLSNFIQRVGIDGSGDVFIHAGFRAFKAEGATIDQLLETILAVQGSKATMMPAFSWRLVSPTAPFSVVSTPSIVGAVSERFRHYPGIRRSLYPTHSCLIRDDLFAAYMTGHRLSRSPCDELSPFAQFADRKVRLVFLNCTIDTMTYIHHFEEMVDPDFYLQDEPEPVSAIDLDGTTHPFALRRHRRLARKFSNFLSDLASTPSFRHLTVGALEGWSISADDAAFVISRRFAENIYASV